MQSSLTTNLVETVDSSDDDSLDDGLAELPSVAVAALVVGNLEIVNSVREQVRLADEMR